jgi:hypothetical protein
MCKLALQSLDLLVSLDLLGCIRLVYIACRLGELRLNRPGASVAASHLFRALLLFLLLLWP